MSYDYPPPPPPVPAAPPRRRRWPWILGGLAVLFVILPVACVALVVAGVEDDGGTVAGSDFSTNTENPPIEDVEILTCAVEMGVVTADLRITNHSSKPSDYLVSITVTADGGTKVGDAVAATQNVASGQVAQVQAIGTATAGGECVVAEVERFAS